jgi:hypothetical protein
MQNLRVLDQEQQGKPLHRAGLHRRQQQYQNET